MVLLLIKTNSPYSDAIRMWEEIDKIPEGVIYHRINYGDEGIDHFFSDKPITNAQIDEEYN